MKSLTPAFYLLSFAFLLVACKKEGEYVSNRRDLLLGTWRRILRATDYNNNGRIDSSDILIAPATDTLILELSPNATSKRTLFYKGVPYPESGTWHLQANDAELVFQPNTSTSKVDTFQIDTLSESYLRYHSFQSGMPIKWEAFTRK